mgnify:CR=1 FL=1
MRIRILLREKMDKTGTIQAEKTREIWLASLPPRQVMLVGDSNTDVFTARNAGVTAVACAVTVASAQSAPAAPAPTDATLLTSPITSSLTVTGTLTGTVTAGAAIAAHAAVSAIKQARSKTRNDKVSEAEK